MTFERLLLIYYLAKEKLPDVVCQFQISKNVEQNRKKVLELDRKIKISKRLIEKRLKALKKL